MLIKMIPKLLIISNILQHLTLIQGRTIIELIDNIRIIREGIPFDTHLLVLNSTRQNLSAYTKIFVLISQMIPQEIPGIRFCRCCSCLNL